MHPAPRRRRPQTHGNHEHASVAKGARQPSKRPRSNRHNELHEDSGRCGRRAPARAMASAPARRGLDLCLSVAVVARRGSAGCWFVDGRPRRQGPRQRPCVRSSALRASSRHQPFPCGTTSPSAHSPLRSSADGAVMASTTFRPATPACWTSCQPTLHETERSMTPLRHLSLGSRFDLKRA